MPGGIWFGPKRDGGKAPGGALALHGLGVLVMLVAGFGLLARLNISSFPWPTWVFIKVGLWLVLGVLPFLARRMKLGGALFGILSLLLVGANAYIATHHNQLFGN